VAFLLLIGRRLYHLIRKADRWRLPRPEPLSPHQPPSETRPAVADLCPPDPRWLSIAESFEFLPGAA